MVHNKFRIMALASIGAGLVLALSWQQGLFRLPSEESLAPGELSGSLIPRTEGMALQFRTVQWSDAGPYAARFQAIIRSEAEWRELNRTQRPSGAPSLPPVDWNRNVLVLIAMGDEGGGAKTMKVLGVRQEGSELRVDLEVADAGARHVGAPYHLIEVPATDVDQLIVQEVTPDQEPASKATTWGKLKTRFGS